MSEFQLQCHGRRLGPPAENRTHASPLEPTEPMAHEAWFVGTPGGDVGLLKVGEALHLAVGQGGTGWHIKRGEVLPLAFDAEMPSALAGRGDLSPHDTERRAPLAGLRWCTVQPGVGDRFLLASGIDLDPNGLDLTGNPKTVLAAIPEAPPPSFFARLLGATPETGAALFASSEPDDPPPTGWLPWLAFHRDRGLEFHCWGTEGGGELFLHREPNPESVQEALLEILRTHELIPPDQFADLYANWRDNEGARADGLTDLVQGAPERGCWRRVDMDELEGVFNAHQGRNDDPVRWSRFLPGSALTERLRQTVDDPVALALHCSPENEAVLVWFIVGGVSNETGELECLLSERVWT